MSEQKLPSLGPEKTVEKSRKKKKNAKKDKQVPQPVFFYMDRQGKPSGRVPQPRQRKEHIAAQAVAQAHFCLDRQRDNALQGSEYSGNMKNEAVKVPAPAKFNVDVKMESKLNGVQSVQSAKNDISLVSVLARPAEDGLANGEQKVKESSDTLGEPAVAEANEPGRILKSKKKKKDKAEKKKVKAEKKEVKAGKQEEHVELQKGKAGKEIKVENMEDKMEEKEDMVEKKQDKVGSKKIKAKKRKKNDAALAKGAASAKGVAVEAMSIQTPEMVSISLEHMVLDYPLVVSGDGRKDYGSPGNAISDGDLLGASDHVKGNENGENGAAEFGKNRKICDKTGTAESEKNGFSEDQLRQSRARKRTKEVAGEYWNWKAAPTAADRKAALKHARESRRKKWRCKLCMVWVSGGLRMDEHIATRKHQTKENYQALHVLLPKRNNRLPPDEVELLKRGEIWRRKKKEKAKKLPKAIMMDKAYENVRQFRQQQEQEKEHWKKTEEQKEKHWKKMEKEREKAEMLGKVWCSACECSFISSVAYETHARITEHITLAGRVNTCTDEFAD